MDAEQLKEALASVKQEDVLHDLRPFFVIYKDGKIQRFSGTLTVPPSLDTLTGVESKDVVISQETGVFVRIYKPPVVKNGDKVPVLVYFHGGGFVWDTASSPMYHNYLNALSSKANVVVVSVDYRRAPEFPLPTAYDDSWAAVEWVGQAVVGGVDEPWIKELADVSRVYFGGDSAGANITHHMAKRFKKNLVREIVLKGLVLIHPYFWGKDYIGSESQKMAASGNEGMVERLWMVAHPQSSGSDDPLINPTKDPELGEMSVEKVMVCVAEHDVLRDRGVLYMEALLKTGWNGAAHVVETEGENHIFHLLNPGTPKVAELMDHIVAFLN